MDGAMLLEKRRTTRSVTSSESCELDETEVEAVKPRAPPDLPDALIEVTRIRESKFRCLQDRESCALEVQSYEKRTAVPGDRQQQEERRAERPEMPLNLKLECGPKRREVTSSMVGSFPVILVKEAQTHFHKIITNAQHLPGCLPADPVGVEIREEISGTSKQNFWCETPLGQVKVQEASEGGEHHVYSRLRTPEQHDEAQTLQSS